jgi:hypothetical protein
MPDLRPNLPPTDPLWDQTLDPDEIRLRAWQMADHEWFVILLRVADFIEAERVRCPK